MTKESVIENMEIEGMEGHEYVRPSGEKQGYVRRKPDRAWLKPFQDDFGKRAALTKGMDGTVLLQDGRVISRSAYAMHKGAHAKSENEPIREEIPEIPAAIPSLGKQEERHSIFDDFEEVLESITIMRKVERGEMDSYLGILLMLDKIKMH